MRFPGKGVIVSAVVLGGSVWPAHGGESGRYTLTPVEEGMMRFDTRTGAVSLCHHVERRWTCDTVSEGDRALHREVERLTEENEALKSEVERLRTRSEITNDRLRAAAERPGRAFPHDRTVAEMMSVLEKMVRGVQEMIGRLDRRRGEKRL